MSNPPTALLDPARRPRILVAGDLMLDRYLWGEVERISPEAPVPVLHVASREHRLGGAGSVAAMLAKLEADVRLAAVTGDDPEGRIVRCLVEEIGVEPQSVFAAAGRPTTVKERFLGQTHRGGGQQMIRVDREDTRPLEADLVGQLLESVWQQLDRLDLILVSDYGKGVCGGDLVPQLVAIARAAGVPVLADPARGVDYHRYAGCTCITPNRAEASRASGIPIRTPEEGLRAARRLLRFGIQSAAVTLDRDGIAWADKQGQSRLFPARPRQVCDITGAGDMVTSALGYCLAAGADYPAALDLANLAAGLEVERLGVVPISRQELMAEASRGGYAPGKKILSPEQAEGELERRRRSGQRIVMTNGCFDLLHPGHVASLQEARKLGDCLLVGLNSDRSVAELKGPGRPIVDQQGRAEMLAALACVDYVVIFDETSVAGLVGRVLPDVLVKSAEYTVEQVVGHETVRRHGGRVVLAPIQGPYSTSRLIERICRAANEAGEALIAE